MNSQFKKGIIEMCVIAVVSRKDMYGFEVIDTLSKAIEVNENTVYPILRRLTDQGYFETYLESTTQGAPRKYFRITVSGKDKMEDYKQEWTKFLSGVYQIMEGTSA